MVVGVGVCGNPMVQRPYHWIAAVLRDPCQVLGAVGEVQETTHGAHHSKAQAIPPCDTDIHNKQTYMDLYAVLRDGRLWGCQEWQP